MKITDGASNKINLLIEGVNEVNGTNEVNGVNINPKVLKNLILAGGAGALGAGLDLYLSGHTDIGDFIKPMGAWGVGGLAGGLGALAGAEQDENKNANKNKNIKIVKEK